MYIQVLDKFLELIKQSGLTFNLRKCHFGLPEVKLLGHIVGSDKHYIDLYRESVVHEMRRPTTKDLRKIFGILWSFSKLHSQLRICRQTFHSLNA
jgi:hypothetical protein